MISVSTAPARSAPLTPASPSVASPSSRASVAVKRCAASSITAVRRSANCWAISWSSSPSSKPLLRAPTCNSTVRSVTRSGRVVTKSLREPTSPTTNTTVGESSSTSFTTRSATPEMLLRLAF
jgi:hypothetical protein